MSTGLTGAHDVARATGTQTLQRRLELCLEDGNVVRDGGAGRGVT